MSLSEASSAAPTAAPSPLTRLARVLARPARFRGDPESLDTGEQAALRRLDPEAPLRPHQIAALARALFQAEIDPDHWSLESWARWTLIAHGLALAGHDGSGRFGEQLARAKVAEARVTKLLTARGAAFRPLIPRLLRLLAAKEVAPNWHELGGLILHEGRDESQAEKFRLRIASRYFATLSQKAHS